MNNSKDEQILNDYAAADYPHGFSSDIKTTRFAAGLNTEIIKKIAELRNEPGWLIDWRLAAFALWQTMTEPRWAAVYYPPIDYQAIHYFAAPQKILSADDAQDPEIQRLFDRLGISLLEQQSLSGAAIDAVIDSISVATTMQKMLKEKGIIFAPLREAIQDYPELVKKYLGAVVPKDDNFFATLNAAVFSDGSFCYIPSGVRCPVELSTYFRLNTAGLGQFERTLIVAEDNSYVSYLEGCTAPARSTHQLHAAVVEIVAQKNSEVRYATVQNWYPGDTDGKGGIYNFVTKRALAKDDARVSWTQVEVGAAITWKYPSVVLQGDRSRGEFYSLALTKHKQQADTGSKMIHLGKNSTSTIFSKGIAFGKSSNSYRGLVKASPSATDCRNKTQCDSLLIGDEAIVNTFPTININSTTVAEHEASVTKISDEQIFYCASRGLTNEAAAGLVVNGFCKNILDRLPVEFAAEARNLLTLSLENSIA